MTRDSATVARERNDEGAFVRQTSAFRDRVTADGSSGYPAVAGRYHLYVSPGRSSSASSRDSPMRYR